MKSFLDEQAILEVFQSGTKTHCSTESALLRLFKLHFLAADSGDCVLLVFLDLTPALGHGHTMDHEIFIYRLVWWVDITG